MRNYSDMVREQEDGAFGECLVRAVAEPLGIEYTTEAETVEAIKKAVCKGTECGAYVHFRADGFTVGTIVEGSDADYSEHVEHAGLDMETDAGAAEYNARFWAAVQQCEIFVDDCLADFRAQDADEQNAVDMI